MTSSLSGQNEKFRHKNQCTGSLIILFGAGAADLSSFVQKQRLHEGQNVATAGIVASCDLQDRVFAETASRARFPQSRARGRPDGVPAAFEPDFIKEIGGIDSKNRQK